VTFVTSRADLPTAGLFLHRHALATFPPETFVAYIAAFMIGGLVDGPYETELLACALEALTPDRVLDDRQRAAVAMFRDFAALRLGEVGIRNYARQQRARRDVQRQ
jgi:hypothetical protein